jgi:hypothetical protein
MGTDMMISKEDHFARLWKVNRIANDFVLWDVWEIPIVTTNSETENFQSFYGVVFEAFQELKTKTMVVSILFTIRYWIGKIFPLDKNINILPIPGCNETTVRSRLNDQDLKTNREGRCIKDTETGLEFCPVYLFEDESLHELSNDTVHGLIHFGWIKKDDNCYTATLAIYVIPRGIYGKTYLKLIEPFRRHIVYPTMMKMFKEQWQKYLLTCNKR